MAFTTAAHQPELKRHVIERGMCVGPFDQREQIAQTVAAERNAERFIEPNALCAQKIKAKEST